jgi:hypothetical protein
MRVQDAIAAADAVLPGHAAPDGEIDPRWQAIITVGKFIESEPEAVWSFVRRWGSSPDADLRDALATCVLEHLLEFHFEQFFPPMEGVARTDPLFADTVSRCWKFGQCAEPGCAERFDRLVASIHRIG